MINHHPFQSSRFNPYEGDQGIEPFQGVIDYVNDKGGLVFWAHPESSYSKDGKKIGPVTLQTKPYPESIKESDNYTGFSAVYGDNITLTNPGNKWDQVLNKYCRGEANHPVWGIAGADFHEEKQGVEIDTFPTIFLAKNKSTSGIMDALRLGRIYAVRKGNVGKLILNQFYLADKTPGNAAIMGETLLMKGRPEIVFSLTSSDRVQCPVEVTLIRGGKVLKTFESEIPLDISFIDQDTWNGKTYYRLMAESKLCGKLVSNPIFAERPAAEIVEQ